MEARAKLQVNYYAYGLKIAAISSKKLGDINEGQLKNQYQWQGDYSEFDDETGWNDFELRSYDAQIGRFVQADPYDQFPSPYTGMGNDPVNFTDPSGGFSVPGAIIGGIGGFIAGGIYALANDTNPVAGAFLGMAGGALLGGLVGDINFSGAGHAVQEALPELGNVARHAAEPIVSVTSNVLTTAATVIPSSLPSPTITIAPNPPPASTPPAAALKIANTPSTALQTPAQPSSAPWMNAARGKLGIRERTGNNDGTDVDKYLRTVGGAGTGWAWCAAFVNWTLRQNDIRGTGRPNALSYLNYGQTLPGPAYGSIAVISHGKGLGHVGFVAGQSPNGSIVLLGGNQGNMVKYSSFSRGSISRFVYPTGYTPSYQLPTITNTSASSFSQTR